jgi:putative MATE family efflux protein
MLVTSLYNIVDQLYIARGVGFLGNAATTVTFPLVTVSLALALLIGIGSAALLSLELGRGNRDCGGKIIGNVFILAALSGIAIMAITLIFQEPILRALGATDAIMPHAKDYSFYIATGFPFVVMGAGVSNIIRADGSPRYSMLSMVSGAILNIILDPIFIFTLGMGTRGAALATAISQAVSCLVAWYYIFFKARFVRLSLRDIRLELSLIPRQLGLGSASCINQFSMTVVNVVLNNTLRVYGAGTDLGADIPIAAMGIVMKINAIFISVILGVVIGAQPILGYNYGAQNFERVKKTFRMDMAITFTVSLLASILFVTAPQFFVSFFRDENPAFNEFAAKAMRIFLCCVFAAGVTIPSANYFQAVGKPAKSMVLNMTRQLIFLVPSIVILPAFIGLDGVLWAMPVTDLLALGVTAYFIIREMKSLGVRPAIDQ